MLTEKDEIQELLKKAKEKIKQEVNALEPLFNIAAEKVVDSVPVPAPGSFEECVSFIMSYIPSHKAEEEESSPTLKYVSTQIEVLAMRKKLISMFQNLKPIISEIYKLDSCQNIIRELDRAIDNFVNTFSQVKIDRIFRNVSEYQEHEDSLVAAAEAEIRQAVNMLKPTFEEVAKNFAADSLPAPGSFEEMLMHTQDKVVIDSLKRKNLSKIQNYMLTIAELAFEKQAQEFKPILDELFEPILGELGLTGIERNDTPCSQAKIHISETCGAIEIEHKNLLEEIQNVEETIEDLLEEIQNVEETTEEQQNREAVEVAKKERNSLMIRLKEMHKRIRQTGRNLEPYYATVKAEVEAEKQAKKKLMLEKIEKNLRSNPITSGSPMRIYQELEGIIDPITSRSPMRTYQEFERIID